MLRSWVCIGLLLGTPLLNGCGRSSSASSSATGQRGVAIVKAARSSHSGFAWDGQFSAYHFEASFNKAFSETLRSFRKLGFELDKKMSRRSSEGAKLYAMNEMKIPSEVEIHTLPEGKIDVRVKMGTVGDRNGSERLLDEILSTILKEKRTP